MMFRKPKTKNIRQRLTDANLDESEFAKKSEDDGLKSSSTVQECPRPMLSFDEGEGDDVADFKIKRKSIHKNSERDNRRHKSSTKRAEAALPGDGLREKMKPPIEQKSEEADHKAAVDSDSDEIIEIDQHVRKTFPSTFSSIPDAKAVYEARKKRELMRKGGGTSDFIPLDDTVKLSEKGQRSRLVREDDENDLSDDDDGGRFYSAKNLVTTEEQQRRDEQETFLRIEQGGSDEEESNHSDEDELLRWEREQIRKGVSSNKVMQLQEELGITSMHYHGHRYFPAQNGEAEMEVDMDLEIIEPQQYSMPSFVLPDNSLSGDANLSMNAILDKIGNRLIDKRERSNVTQASLERVSANIAENITTTAKLESTIPCVQQHYQLFQELRLYVRDLLECLNEKIEEINSLDEKIVGMWRRRAERLTKRRREDVQDQYEKCKFITQNKLWAPSPEYIKRETEREARRSRRRRDRVQRSIDTHSEGLSSDDEETQCQEIEYKTTISSALERAKNIFYDASDEFCQLDFIVDRFVGWLIADEKSFEDAFVFLCIPKLISPFIRLEMLDWNPLMNPKKLYTHNWYQKLLLLGMNNTGLDMQSPFLVNLIPSVVEKIILPKIASAIREQWDPLSLSQSVNLATTLNEIIDDYPVANCSSKRMKEVIKELYKKIQDAIQNDTFVPVYTKESIERVETGCKSFLDRQFWQTIKLIRSIMQFKRILSENCLEELLIEGIINRSTVWALDLSASSDPVTKCLAVIEQIPPSWFPSTKPQSYQSLIRILTQISNDHRTSNDFFRKAEKFLKRATKLIKTEAIGD